MAKKPAPRSECCNDYLNTEEPGFQPLLKTWDEVREALAKGQPVFCGCCGEDVSALGGTA